MTGKPCGSCREYQLAIMRARKRVREQQKLIDWYPTESNEKRLSEYRLQLLTWRNLRDKHLAEAHQR